MLMRCSYTVLAKYFRQKVALVLSQTGLVASLFGISLFNHLGFDWLMLFSILLFICFYDFGVGAIAYIHIFETNIDSIVGFANQLIFFMVFSTCIMMPTLIEKLTVTGTFLFYGTCSFLGLIHMIVFIEHTSYLKINKITNKFEIIKLTEK